ncbi:MAG TPA: pyridoxal phosphate-dependent aminotransferase, partial [Pirellulales bacterium]|nr:pyridoxal phosphate-dependent aminotransferase [Pirellulales bacterium]
GIAPLREKLAAQIASQYGHADRDLVVTSGTSGGLVLAMLALVNPGDEVIVFDPYFVMYESLVRLAGGTMVLVDTYPHFQIDVNRVHAALTPRTRMILFNSPANPTGAVASLETTRELAILARERNIELVSDEIYRLFQYDQPFHSPALFNDRTIVIDGMSKAYGMTGWRVGYAHGPREIIQAMTRLQQYTFVCAPHPLQWGAAAALDMNMDEHIAHYRRKRDRIVEGLRDYYSVATPGGAFYAFPQVPWGTADEFVAEALRRELLIIPGNVFSRRATHFRISYAAPDEVLERGIEVLRALARR